MRLVEYEFYQEEIPVFCPVRYYECHILYDNVFSEKVIRPLLGPDNTYTYDYYQINIVLTDDPYEWGILARDHPDIIVLNSRNYSGCLIYNYKVVVIKESSVYKKQLIRNLFQLHHKNKVFARLIYDNATKTLDIRSVVTYTIKGTIQGCITGITCESLKPKLYKVYINDRSRPILDQVALTSAMRRYDYMLEYLNDGICRDTTGYDLITRCCRYMYDSKNATNNGYYCQFCNHPNTSPLSLTNIDNSGNLLLDIFTRPDVLYHKLYQRFFSGERDNPQHNKYLVLCTKNFTPIISGIARDLYYKINVNGKVDKGQKITIIDRSDRIPNTTENITDIILINKKRSTASRVISHINNLYRPHNIYIHII